MITGCDYDMAKKKKKKTKSKSTLEIGIEVYALLLIFISILGLGKLGPVGKLITSFSLFLTAFSSPQQRSFVAFFDTV